MNQIESNKAKKKNPLFGFGNALKNKVKKEI